MAELTSLIKWNKVEDGLPDEDMTVLMVVECNPGQYDKPVHEVDPGVLENGYWRYLNGFQVSKRDRVTHWADLPEFQEEN